MASAKHSRLGLKDANILNPWISSDSLQLSVASTIAVSSVDIMPISHIDSKVPLRRGGRLDNAPTFHNLTHLPP